MTFLFIPRDALAVHAKLDELLRARSEPAQLDEEEKADARHRDEQV